MSGGGAPSSPVLQPEVCTPVLQCEVHLPFQVQFYNLRFVLPFYNVRSTFPAMCPGTTGFQNMKWSNLFFLFSDILHSRRLPQQEPLERLCPWKVPSDFSPPSVA